MTATPSAYPDTSRAWLEKLVAFDTTSHKSNMALINYVAGYLTSLGITPVLVKTPDGEKANLLATIPAADGSTKGGIILSGHTDVVPVAGQQWDSDPFVLTEKDGKLYGRGSCDMKGFIAAVLAITPRLQAMRRAKPVHFCFSHDEETGCIGVRSAVAYMKQHDISAEACVVGEPTNLLVNTGNKGLAKYTIKVKGKAIHSSLALMNTSCNAIEWASAIITKIRQVALEIKATDKWDSNYTCPFSCVTTGLISGGNAVNTVPAECEFTYSIRLTDPQTATHFDTQIRTFVNEKIVPAMKEEYAEAGVELIADSYLPPFNAQEDHPLTQKVRDICKDHGTIRKKGGGTEAGYFQDDLKVPTVIVGPGCVEQAHQPNEYVLAEELPRCEQLLTLIVASQTGEKGKL